MANEVTIVVKTDDRTNLRSIGAGLKREATRASKGFTASMRKQIVTDSGRIGRDSGNNLGNSFSRTVAPTLKGGAATASGGMVSAFASGTRAISSNWILMVAAIGAAIGALPAVGAVAAAGIVAAFGAGIAGMGLAATFQNKAVQKEFKQTKDVVVKTVQEISKPFVGTWKEIFAQTQSVTKHFKGPLKDAIANFIAPATTGFVKAFGESLKELTPAIQPLSAAFASILSELGPKLGPVLKQLSGALISMSSAVADNADEITGFIAGLLKIVAAGVTFLGWLTRVFGAFVRFGAILSSIKAQVAALAAFPPVRFVISAIDKAKGVINGAKRLATGFARGVYRASMWAVDKTKSIISGARNRAISFAKGFYRANIRAADLATRVIRNPTQYARAFARGFYRANIRAFDFASGVIRRVIGFIRNVPRSITVSIRGVMSGFNPFAHGGIIGAAGGGPRSRMTLVGEQGPELVDLAPGSTVRSNPDTRRMLSQGGIGGQPYVIHQTIELDGKVIAEQIFDPFKGVIRKKGGKGPASVQRALGWS